MAMRIGCDNLHYALMTTEDTALTPPTYATIKTAPGVMHVNINPNASLATAFFDDGPGDTAATLGNIEVEIQKNTLTTENKADLLGHVIDANGGVVYADDDVPPYVAIAFRTLSQTENIGMSGCIKGALQTRRITVKRKLTVSISSLILSPASSLN